MLKRTTIFAVSALLLSCAALVGARYWALYPFDHWQEIGTGEKVRDFTKQPDLIRQTYPIHLVDPRSLQPQVYKGFRLPPPYTGQITYDLTMGWAMAETRARLALVFLVWFASIIGLHVFAVKSGTANG
jgi:hypothetical protein